MRAATGPRPGSGIETETGRFLQAVKNFLISWCLDMSKSNLLGVYDCSSHSNLPLRSRAHEHNKQCQRMGKILRLSHQCCSRSKSTEM